MNATAISVTIISSLISGLVAVVVSIVWHRRAEARRTKRDSLIRLFANRYDLKGDEFSRALNQDFVVFNECGGVTTALSAFHSEVVAGRPTDDARLRLIKAMRSDATVNFCDFNDPFFLKPFNTRL